MGFLKNKRVENEINAKNILKIINDCKRIVNSTKNPDIYFERYSLLEEKARELCTIKHIHFTGTQPKKIVKIVAGSKQASIRAMIDRYFDDISIKARRLKTKKAKREKIYSFITTLEDHYGYMNEENVQYIQTLYNNAMQYFDLDEK